MNTTISTGQPPGQGFLDWLAFCRANPDLDVAAMFARGTPILSRQEAAAYGAPFPDQVSKAGVRRFPELVMIDPAMEGVDVSKRALNWWKTEWSGQSFMAVGMQDTVISPKAMEWLRSHIKGCPQPMEIADAGHFVQEWGAPVATAALAAFGDV